MRWVAIVCFFLLLLVLSQMRSPKPGLLEERVHSHKHIHTDQFHHQHHHHGQVNGAHYHFHEHHGKTTGD